MLRHIKKRTILFLCQDNATSSQMAEAIARRLAPPETKIFSAGVSPAEIPPQVAAVLREVGINIAEQKPKGLSDVPLEEIDLAITLSPEIKENCPGLPQRTKVVHWSLPDTKNARGGDAAMNAVFRYMRDEIDKKVAALFLDYWRNAAKDH
jgi:protein-tyrosine-phosphatase